ncbi:MAG: hypothetical protein EON59_15115, partial [Alphaproteobacteria bacterium]
MIPWRHAGGAEKELVKRGELRCWLGLPGAPEEDWVPAVVRVDADDSSVAVELFAAGPGWATTVGGRGTMVLHGRTADDGHAFTLLEPYVSRAVFGVPDHEPRALRGGTLVLGAHTGRETTWSQVRYRTGRLHEWLGQSGLRDDAQLDDDHLVAVVTQTWTRPAPLHVTHSQAEISIYGILAEHIPAGPREPASSLRSDTEVVVRVENARTDRDLYREFGLPLIAFTALASSRPDWLLLDVASDRGRGETVRVVGQGTTPKNWAWTSSRDRFLFTAEDIEDPAQFLSRWLALWPSVRDSAVTYANALRGDIYTRARVSEVVAALEAYWHGKFYDPGRKKQPTLVGKFKALVAHTGVKATQLAANEQQLQDLADARNLYAHLH